MRWNRTLLVLPLLAGLPLAASAGWFKHGQKPDPATRVPELIATVKTDGDESKRAAAAEELRQYDPATQPDIVPILIDVLMHDAKPAVRAEAAQSLSKLRPVSQEAGWALEQAAAKDASMRVRLQARSALLMYHMSGYHSPKVEEPAGNQSKEPPLADATPGSAKVGPAPATAAGAAKAGPTATVVPPTDNRLKPVPTPVTPVTAPKPPALRPVPASPPPPPATPPGPALDQGPALTPP